ncbi:MAG: hypothetical protein V4558_05105 [Gemmatimonadota bacterium]
MKPLHYRTLAALALLLTAAACNLSPLRNRIKVGEEPIVVFVGEGVDGNTDLFVVPAGGGTIVQLTFTPLRESMPRINLRGDAVAFLRARDTLATSANEVILMNLLNGAERQLPVPDSAGRITMIAWGGSGNTLYVRSARGSWLLSTPPEPARAVAATGAEVARADSFFQLWVGTPPFAYITRCAGGGICAQGPVVKATTLTTEGHDPLLWGTDSVAWFEGDGMVIRGIGPGTVRRMLWRHPPGHPRDGSYSGVTEAGR